MAFIPMANGGGTTETSSITTTSYVKTNNVNLEKNGKVVCMNGRFLNGGSWTSGTSYTVGTLPQGYCPTSQFHISACSATAQKFGDGTIDADGTIKVRMYATFNDGAAWIQLNSTWITN